MAETEDPRPPLDVAELMARKLVPEAKDKYPYRAMRALCEVVGEAVNERLAERDERIARLEVLVRDLRAARTSQPTWPLVDLGRSPLVKLMAAGVGQVGEILRGEMRQLMADHEQRHHAR